MKNTEISTKEKEGSSLEQSSAFDQLAHIIDILLGPNGCPWDREQTLLTLKKHTLEEMYEVIDAIQEGDNENIADELGDLIVNCIFLAKVSQKEGRFDWEKPCLLAKEKLIRRHPHIFGEEKDNQLTSDEVLRRWDAVKKKEKSGKKRKTISESIPASFPSLLRLQKLVGKMLRDPDGTRTLETFLSQSPPDHLESSLLRHIYEAEKRNIQLEEAMREYYSKVAQLADSELSAHRDLPN